MVGCLILLNVLYLCAAKMKQNFYIFPLLLLIQACSLDQSDLSGHWKAVAFYENGAAVPVPLDSVALALTPDGHYSFTSTGFYREEGQYRCSMRYLFLNDTTVRPARERMVQVLYVSPDTLKIKMGKDGKEQVLFLTKR